MNAAVDVCCQETPISPLKQAYMADKFWMTQVITQERKWAVADSFAETNKT